MISWRANYFYVVDCPIRMYRQQIMIDIDQRSNISMVFFLYVVHFQTSFERVTYAIPPFLFSTRSLINNFTLKNLDITIIHIKRNGGRVHINLSPPSIPLSFFFLWKVIKKKWSWVCRILAPKSLRWWSWGWPRVGKLWSKFYENNT